MTFRRFASKMIGIAFIIMVLFSVVMVQCLEAELATEKPDSPKIGLVLSGGGARGAAHIGVIKVLEELKIPIHCIVGTSMGSIVGGLYASGMSVEELQETVIGLDWFAAFDDDTPRKDRSFRRKQDDKLYLFKMKPGFNDGSIDFAKGVIQGQKIDLLLKSLSIPVEGIRDFDRFRIPFRAVATDIVTGSPVILGEGNLALAMRASMSIPAFISPVEIDGRLLVDGGVSNNLPVDVARQMGADTLIVIDISTPLKTREELKNAFAITGQLTGILTRSNTEAQIATLGENDILIVPDLTGISSSDFDKVGDAIPRGFAAADQNRAILSRLSVDEAVYRTYLAGRMVRDTSMPVIDFVNLSNHSRVSDEVIRSRLHVRLGEPLDIPSLDMDIDNIYGLELFENIRYEIVEEDNRTGILLHVQERSWGPNYVQFGLESSNNFQGDSIFNVGLSYTRTAMNALNGEWRSTIQLGEEPGFATDFYQPLDARSRYFVNPSLTYVTTSISQYEHGNQVTEYRSTRYGLNLTAGRELGAWGEFRLGYRRMAGEMELRVGDPDKPDYDFDTGEIFLKLSMDELNEIPFPTSGRSSNIEWVSARKNLGSDSDYDQIRFVLGRAFTRGRHTLIGSVLYETTLDNDAPLESLFTAGGLFRLSGFNQDELSGQHFGIMRVAYFRRFGEFELLPIYIGGSLEKGNVWDQRGDINFRSALTAGSLFIGLDTPIGPVHLGGGMAENDNQSVYLYIGNLF